MKIIDDKIKCGNLWEELAVNSILWPDLYYPKYLHPKAKKYYNKLLANKELYNKIIKIKEKKLK